MEKWEAIQPSGPAWLVMGSNPVSGATLIQSVTGKYAIAALGSNVCFLGYGMTSDAARSAAVNLLLGAGPAQNCIPVAWGTTGPNPRGFTLAPNQFFAGLSASGTGIAPVVIIPCDGI